MAGRDPAMAIVISGNKYQCRHPADATWFSPRSAGRRAVAPVPYRIHHAVGADPRIADLADTVTPVPGRAHMDSPGRPVMPTNRHRAVRRTA